ncbi:hypothetical protein POPTR_019G070200v4, partial [Populus trichocarpa]
SVTCEAGLSTSGFIQTRNAQLVLNGSQFLFTPPSQRYKVSNVFHEATAASLTVSLQISPGVYNEHVFQGLDFVIFEARKYIICFILTLSNNYHDFGGRPQYVNWARAAGVPINKDDDFYTNAVVKGYCKNHVKVYILSTKSNIVYMDEPTIMAWELINEPHCHVDYSGKTVNGWVQEMAPFVKSINTKHLLSVGMKGFYGDSIPNRKHRFYYLRRHVAKIINMVLFYQIYRVSGQNDNAQMEFMQRWMSSHWTDSKTILKKPLVFAEFGKSNKDPGYTTSVRDSFLNTVHTSIYNSARNGGTIGGGFVWQILAEGMDSYYDGYEIVLSQNPSTSSVIAQQSNKMMTFEHIEKANLK